jgi:N-methylhydantoinase B/oxoprolinase/acetone carboxylase alpha subunit
MTRKVAHMAKEFGQTGEIDLLIEIWDHLSENEQAHIRKRLREMECGTAVAGDRMTPAKEPTSPFGAALTAALRRESQQRGH